FVEDARPRRQELARHRPRVAVQRRRRADAVSQWVVGCIDAKATTESTELTERSFCSVRSVRSVVSAPRYTLPHAYRRLPALGVDNRGLLCRRRTVAAPRSARSGADAVAERLDNRAGGASCAGRQPAARDHAVR